MSNAQRIVLVLFGIAALVILWVVGSYFGVRTDLLLSTIAYLLLVRGVL